MTRKPHRQGDVIFIPIDEMPKDVKRVERDDRGRIVLAEGESTGHAHCVLDDPATLFVASDLDEMADSFLRAEAEVLSLHEEHAPVALERGDWIVRQKREYQPERSRFVAD